MRLDDISRSPSMRDESAVVHDDYFRGLRAFSTLRCAISARLRASPLLANTLLTVGLLEIDCWLLHFFFCLASLEMREVLPVLSSFGFRHFADFAPRPRFVAPPRQPCQS